MGRQNHVVQAEVGGIFQRFLAEDIEGSAGHLPGADGVHQSRVVDQLAASTIDDTRALPHRGQRPGVDDPRSLGSKPHVQGQVI